MINVDDEIFIPRKQIYTEKKNWEGKSSFLTKYSTPVINSQRKLRISNWLYLNLLLISQRVKMLPENHFSPIKYPSPSMTTKMEPVDICASLRKKIFPDKKCSLGLMENTSKLRLIVFEEAKPTCTVGIQKRSI